MALNFGSQCIGLAGLLAVAAGAKGQLTEPKPYAVFALDADLHAVYLMQDLNFDGDADDPGERWPFLDHTNALGIPLQSSSLVSMCRSDYWPVGIFVVDSTLRAVYRAFDDTSDKDALDAGEMNVWWDGWIDNRNIGSIMHSATFVGGRVYVQVGFSTMFRNGAIVWTEDLNNDGDALDPGESGEWIQGTFEQGFLGNQRNGFVIRSTSYDGDQVLFIHDDDGDGKIGHGETNVFIQDGNLAGVPVSTRALGATYYDTLYLLGDTSGGEPLTLWRLTDHNSNNVIDLVSEVELIWDESHLPAGVTLGEVTGASIGEFAQVVTMAFDDGAANRFMLRLVDWDNDRTFNGAGETEVWASDPGPGVVPDRIVDIAVIGPECYADCDQSTGFGVLDIFDFLCFQNAFVTQQAYACDCDTSTGPYWCDIFDFLCFQNAWVRGCL